MRGRDLLKVSSTHVIYHHPKAHCANKCKHAQSHMCVSHTSNYSSNIMACSEFNQLSYRAYGWGRFWRDVLSTFDTSVMISDFRLRVQIQKTSAYALTLNSKSKIKFRIQNWISKSWSWKKKSNSAIQIEILSRYLKSEIWNLKCNFDFRCFGFRFRFGFKSMSNLTNISSRSANNEIHVHADSLT